MKPRSPDPVLQSAWREALIVFGIWGAALVWCVTYAALYGYNRTTADLTFVLGFPDWIFWGVVVPWVSCVVVSAIVSQVLMRDEDLGIDPEEAMKEIIGEDPDA
jgi:hypothetical protein